MADQFNFGQLTKEMIMSRLKEASNASEAAAEIAKKTIVAGVQATRTAGQNPKETVEEICYGAMSGLLLIEKDLPQSAILILRNLAEISNELNAEPSELMTWAMGGIAKISAVISRDILYDIRCRIEEEYQGTGEVFAKLCEPYEPK